VLKPDQTASMRKIAVQKQDEMQTVVASGLAPPESVITSGFGRLTDGAKVTLGGGPQRTAPPGAHPPGVGQDSAQAHERRQGGHRKTPAQ